MAVAWVMMFVMVNTTLALAGTDLLPWANLVLLTGAAVSYEYAR